MFFPKRQQHNIVQLSGLSGGTLVQKAAILPFCWPEVGRTKEMVKETNLHLGQRSKRENAIWPGWLAEPQIFARSGNTNWFCGRQQ